MQYRTQSYVGVQFLKDSSLISNPSVFFKCIPQKYKLKVVSEKLFNEIQTIKNSLSDVMDQEVILPPWIVAFNDPEIIYDTDSKPKFEDVDYLDFITLDFYQSAKWVGYNKRTKIGG